MIDHSELFATFKVVAQDDRAFLVRVEASERWFSFSAEALDDNHSLIAFRTAGATPGFGLGDHAIAWQQSEREGLWHEENSVSGVNSHFKRPLSTDITGFEMSNYTSSSGYITRAVSNFVIYPKQNFAVINYEPNAKYVVSTESQIIQGSEDARGLTNLHYYFGAPQSIYKSFLDARNSLGYPVKQPKYAFFGVGWEAWGALAWKTAQNTVRADVDRYLAEGYPLSWMVIGSGFWPKNDPDLQVTTSFGLWDQSLYPDHSGLIQHFRDQGLAVMLGLRIGFTQNGPFTEEGLSKGYFLALDGAPKLYQLYDFPKAPIYILDETNEEAVAWYVELAKKWGVDGFKEDLYSYDQYEFRDDKLNLVNEKLMDAGFYIMQRNTYLTSAGELHRIDDFNYDQNQDRGPINSLIYAYSGLPLTYMDIVGGKFGGSDIDELKDHRIRRYMMRNARIASLHSSMSMGKGPWHFEDELLEEVVLDAAKDHARLHPYIYSQAVRFFEDGYPWTMAPLPIAFPNDEAVYNRENEIVRGYQWMIGDALLAVPLYGEDYELAERRDVYLPEGTWIDYDNGKSYTGPKLLKDFDMPVTKTPLFVGGTGFVVEADGEKLKGRVYPIGSNQATIINGPAGQKSTITISDPDWGAATVIRSDTQEEVASSWVRHALEFEFEHGVSYSIN